jgi:hypothetical protein
MSQQVVHARPGQTSLTVDVLLLQNSGSTAAGDPILGLAYNTASLVAYYRMPPAGSVTSIALATQTVGGAYSSGGFVQLSSANMPGMYRFDIPNACVVAAGSYGECNIMISGAAAGTVGTLEPHLIKLEMGDIAGVALTQLAEAVAALSTAPTLAQAIYGINQRMCPASRSISGVTETVTKVDGATTVMTYTLNNSGNPTAITRAS